MITPACHCGLNAPPRGLDSPWGRTEAAVHPWDHQPPGMRAWPFQAPGPPYQRGEEKDHPPLGSSRRSPRGTRPRRTRHSGGSEMRTIDAGRTAVLWLAITLAGSTIDGVSAQTLVPERIGTVSIPLSINIHVALMSDETTACVVELSPRVRTAGVRTLR